MHTTTPLAFDRCFWSDVSVCLTTGARAAVAVLVQLFVVFIFAAVVIGVVFQVYNGVQGEKQSG